LPEADTLTLSRRQVRDEDVRRGGNQRQIATQAGAERELPQQNVTRATDAHAHLMDDGNRTNEMR